MLRSSRLSFSFIFSEFAVINFFFPEFCMKLVGCCAFTNGGEQLAVMFLFVSHPVENMDQFRITGRSKKGQSKFKSCRKA